MVKKVLFVLGLILIFSLGGFVSAADKPTDSYVGSYINTRMNTHGSVAQVIIPGNTSAGVTKNQLGTYFYEKYNTYNYVLVPVPSIGNYGTGDSTFAQYGYLDVVQGTGLRVVSISVYSGSTFLYSQTYNQYGTGAAKTYTVSMPNKLNNMGYALYVTVYGASATTSNNYFRVTSAGMNFNW